MNDLQRALSNTLVEFIVDRRLAGKRLTEAQRAFVIWLAVELGMPLKVDPR